MAYGGIGRHAPPYYQLLHEVEELGYKGVGKKYNVSDNAIRKWIKNYEKISLGAEIGKAE